MVLGTERAGPFLLFVFHHGKTLCERHAISFSWTSSLLESLAQSVQFIFYSLRYSVITTWNGTTTENGVTGLPAAVTKAWKRDSCFWDETKAADGRSRRSFATAPLLQESSQRQRSHHHGSKLFLTLTVCSSLMGPKCAREVDVVEPSHPKTIFLKGLNHKPLCRFLFSKRHCWI